MSSLREKAARIGRSVAEQAAARQEWLYGAVLVVGLALVALSEVVALWPR